MEDLPIICFANDWDNDPTSKHQVMSILSRTHRILWVNSIGMRRNVLSHATAGKALGRLRNCMKGLCKVHDNLYYFTPVILPFHSSPLARLINKYLLTLAISLYKKKLHMTRVQLWTFLPNAVELLGCLGEELVLYYCVDKWSSFSFIDGKSMEMQENNLTKRADIVLATADRLYEEKIKLNPNTHLVTHGVDYDYFSRAMLPLAVPDRIRSLPKPILGFFGAIQEWIDLPLLEKIAEQRPDWSLVIIGKIQVDVTNLRGHKNMHFLGHVPYRQLVNYCKAFDVGMIPFLVNELTISVNPIKLREYLAAGLPVVSTRLPEVEKYAPHVEICDSPEEMIKRIEVILKTDSYEKKLARSKAMKQETWEIKVEKISNLVSEFMRARKNTDSHR